MVWGKPVLVSGGVAPVGAFVFSVAGKGGLRNNIEILCTLYPVFPIFVTLWHDITERMLTLH